MAKVNIFETNGALGTPQSNKDGVVGLIGSAVVVADKFALGDVLELYSKEDAEALGIDEAYDSDNSVGLWHHVRDFYEEAGAGVKLFLMPVATTVTLSEMADKDLEYATTLVAQTKGEVRIIGLCKSGASLASTKGFDDDAYAAIAKAKALSDALFLEHRTVSFIIEGKGYAGNAGNLEDLRASDGPNANRVSVYLGQGDLGGASANIGLLLGRLAAIPVQSNVGRVKDGELAVMELNLSDGTSVANIDLVTLEAINNKGYIVPRYYDNKPGFYFFDDPTCCPITDDYAWIHRGRPMDKAHRLTNGVFVDELLDDINIDPDTGQMEASVAKYFQRQCEKTIQTNMMGSSRKEISSVKLLVDPAQNVLSTSKVIAKLRIVPKGMTREFEIEIGYSNPFNT